MKSFYQYFCNKMRGQKKINGFIAKYNHLDVEIRQAIRIYDGRIYDGTVRSIENFYYLEFSRHVEIMSFIKDEKQS